MISDLLTVQEITTRYAPNWVHVVDIESDEVHHIRRVRVVFR